MAWSVDGRRVAITGPSSGLGRATALQLAGEGAELVLAGRPSERMDQVAAEITARGHAAEVVALDLGSLDSVEQAADRIASGGPIAALVNNAGVAGARGITSDGFEKTFAINYLGHVHLTWLLGDRLAGGRVVNVASNAHFDAEGIDWEAVTQPTRSRTGVPEYAVSKLAMVLWSRELARRWDDLDVYCVHPGVVATRIWRRIPQPVRWLLTRRMKDPEEAAATQVRCVVDPELEGRSGEYWVNRQPGRVSAIAADDDLAAELWRRTETWLSRRDG